jgi:hypothetical protein
MANISMIPIHVLRETTCYGQVIDRITVDVPDNASYTARSRTSDTVLWNHHPNIVPQYQQSATGTLVDYQSDQRSRYLHSQFAVGNTLVDSCPYETPIYSSANPYHERTVRHNPDGSVGTEPGSFLPGQAVMGSCNQLDSQALVPNPLFNMADDIIQPPQSRPLETQSRKPPKSPSTGSGYDLIHSVTGVFWNIERFGNRDLPELSFTTTRNSMEALVEFAVENPACAIPNDAQRPKDSGHSLTEVLTMLVDKALEVPGKYVFRIYSDECSTKVHILH